MESFWTTLLGILAGAIGYLVVTFWYQPIIRYRDIKYDVAAGLVFFANAIELEKQNGELRADTLKRKECNRLNAAKLTAIYTDLPYWYQRWLYRRGEDPLEASRELIGLSNSSSGDEAKGYDAGIRKNLRLPSKLKG